MEKEKLSGKYFRNSHDLMPGEIIHYKNTLKGKVLQDRKNQKKLQQLNENNSENYCSRWNLSNICEQIF